MAERQIIRVTYMERKSGKLADRFFNNVDSFSDAAILAILREVRAKGDIIEVWRVNKQHQGIDEVRWKHLY